MRKFILLFFVCILLLLGCYNNDDNYNGDGTISYKYAKELIINNNAKLVDVRTAEEYNDKHINGALLLTLGDINDEKSKEIIGDFDSYVIVYCKSGVRSKEAKNKLNELGYNNVYDLGSLDNWKE